ncbi:MAG TPA: peptide chain release factor N(5)-glutamine methyltransferase [Gemmatimonadales bacterium]|nr:peptide chain release factor N(5)-glutamine methyltransferase [Gemmatimonadales bacterium]
MYPEPALSRGALLAGAAELLAASGAADPRREAFRLWSDLAGGDAAGAVVHPEAPVEARLAGRVLAAAARRARGEPLAHVTGRIGFRRLVLRSDHRALIPRPETEGLVELLLRRVRHGRVADLGTGTGAVALSLAQEGGFEQVLAVDLSSAALGLAAENRALTGLDVGLVRGDLCQALAPASLDALVANPPYLTRGEYAALDPSVRDWEPAEALVSGADGLEATGRLLDEGRRVLRAGGWLAVEVDCTRAGACVRRARALGWSEIAIHADLFGRERYLLARRSPTP